MNHLITYGFHKSGHYYVAKAIEQELIARNENVELNAFYPHLGDLINRFFFEIFLEFENKRITEVPEVIIKEKTLRLMSEIAVEKNIIDFSVYDSVITTHQHTTRLIAEIKRIQKHKFYLADCNCNYDLFPLISDPDINAYFGARPLVEVPLSTYTKMHTTGIPISPNFKYIPEMKEDLIVIIGGVHGMGAIEDSVSIIKKAKHDYRVVIVTGNNNALREMLTSSIDDGRFEIRGFVEDMSELYNKSKIVVTKGSGVSIAEATASGNVLIFPKPNLFWEGISADYIASKGAGVVMEGNGFDIEKVENLLDRRDIYNWHRDNAVRLSRPNAAKSLVDIALQQKMNEASPLYSRITQLRDVFQKKEQAFESSSRLSPTEEELYHFIKSEIDRYFKRMTS